MLDVNCPHCHKVLTLTNRKGLLFGPSISCIHCYRLVKVKEESGIVNSWFLGTFLGISMKFFFDVNIQTIIVVTLVVVFGFQRFMDIFYSLESAEDDLYW